MEVAVSLVDGRTGRPQSAGFSRAVVSSRAAKGVRQGAVFDIRQEDTEGRYRLVLTGELDMAGADKLEAAITRLCTAGALEIALDLRQLTFIDSQGLRAILAARETCADHHAEYFLIRGDHPAQQRLFEVTGLLDVLPWRQPGHEPS